MAIVALCFVLVVIVGCSSGETRLHPREPDRMMDLPTASLARCERTEYIRTTCPHRLPSVKSDYRRVITTDEQESPRYRLMSLEWGAPHEGFDPRNSPPRFVHLIIWGGDLERAWPWRRPGGPSRIEGEPPHEREHATLLATPRWTDEEGDLVLAPSYPSGGMNGEHLMYMWTEEETEFALSLHAWDPISETIGALRAIVRSIPDHDQVAASGDTSLLAGRLPTRCKSLWQVCKEKHGQDQVDARRQNEAAVVPSGRG